MHQPTGKYRWTVVALLFFATTINYLDRQVISLLKPALEKEFNWTESDYGKLVMSFSAAYALGLLFFGRMIDRIGTRLGYAVSIVWWSIAAMLHAGARSVVSFAAARALLGVGESGNFPAAIKAVAEWFPKKDRAFATGIFNSGTNIGAVAAPILVPLITAAFGWQMAFVLTGALGFFWLVFWLVFYEVPARQKRLTQAEYVYIRSDAAEQTVDDIPVGWGRLFRIRQTWAFLFGKMLTDPIWYFFLFWLPSYFSTTFQIDLKKPSPELVIIYTASSIGSIGGGYLSGRLIRNGWPVFRARKASMLLFALCVLPIVTARFAGNVWVVVGLISLATAAHQAWSANMYTTVSDMFPAKAVSSVVGIGGMAGAVGGILFPLFIGQLLDAYKSSGNLGGGYNLLFAMCGLAYLAAWCLMHFFAPKMEKVNL